MRTRTKLFHLLFTVYFSICFGIFGRTRQEEKLFILLLEFFFYICTMAFYTRRHILLEVFLDPINYVLCIVSLNIIKNTINVLIWYQILLEGGNSKLSREDYVLKFLFLGWIFICVWIINWYDRKLIINFIRLLLNPFSLPPI